MIDISALNELKKLLHEILGKKGREKLKLVHEFENKLNSFWEQDKEIFDEQTSDVFSELLNDMAYYQPNAVIRATDKNLFNDFNLDDFIKKALEKIK